jgi:hypothetical protein
MTEDSTAFWQRYSCLTLSKYFSCDCQYFVDVSDRFVTPNALNAENFDIATMYSEMCVALWEETQEEEEQVSFPKHDRTAG